MTTVEVATVAQPIVAAIVGFGQIAVVAWGIRAMIAANAERAAAAAKAAEEARQRYEESREEARRRHEEAMAGIAEAARQFDKRLEASTAAAAEEARQRHEEAMAAIAGEARQQREEARQQREETRQQREEAERRHKESMVALKALIARHNVPDDAS